MKKWMITFILATALLILPGYDKNNIVLKDVEVTVIKAEDILWYDLILKNIGDTDITSEYEYPGHDHSGFEVVVRPNAKLEKMMEMEEKSKYKKMMFRGGGGTGFLKIGDDAKFHIDYQIKETANLDDIKTAAFDGTLILLDGHNIVKEIPLSEVKSGK